MMKVISCFAILLLSSSAFGSSRMATLDRTGDVFLAPRAAISVPIGALADVNYNSVAASWRKEGFTFATQVGWYFTNSTVAGIELSYSDFRAKPLAALANPARQDKSRVRVRTASVFVQYQMVPRGSVRPFLKCAVGFFDLDRFSLPQPETVPLSYQDFSLTGDPIFSGGIGFIWYCSEWVSCSFSVEFVYLNSFSASWATDGEGGQLKANLMYLPFYFGLVYHFGDGN